METVSYSLSKRIAGESKSSSVKLLFRPIRIVSPLATLNVLPLSGPLNIVNMQCESSPEFRLLSCKSKNDKTSSEKKLLQIEAEKNGKRKI